MSWFLTALIEENISIQKINSLAKKYNLKFTHIENEFIRKKLPYKTRYYWVEWIDNKFFTALEKMEDEDTINNRLDALCGISSEYVQRLKKELVEERLCRHTCMDNWLNFIKDMILGEHANIIGYLMHFYKEDPATERIRIVRTEIIHIKVFAIENIDNFEEDVLYLIFGE